MDHAYLLQRAGRNLRRLHGRSRRTPPRPSRTLQIRRPTLPSPRRHHHSHLHRRFTLLRRQSLARLSQRHSPHLILVAFHVGFPHTLADLSNARIESFFARPRAAARSRNPSSRRHSHQLHRPHQSFNRRPDSENRTRPFSRRARYALFGLFLHVLRLPLFHRLVHRPLQRQLRSWSRLSALVRSHCRHRSRPRLRSLIRHASSSWRRRVGCVPLFFQSPFEIRPGTRARIRQRHHHCRYAHGPRHRHSRRRPPDGQVRLASGLHRHRPHQFALAARLVSFHASRAGPSA